MFLYYNLLTKGKLCEHLAEVDRRAEDMILRYVEEMAKQESVTEKLKADDIIAWIRRMNNIHDRATEVVNTEIIYTI